MVALIEADLGQVDILVNNAGIVSAKPLPEITEADWDEMLAVNLKIRLPGDPKGAAGHAGPALGADHQSLFRGGPDRWGHRAATTPPPRRGCWG